jgi:catechol 2,3-dioxygenase-like lactoylglutathione lyase family enzyme
MPICDFNHYFVRVKDLERSRQFYCDVLGFEIMPRPPIDFPGYWLGVGGRTQIHMGVDGAPGADKSYLGTTARSARDNSGVIDHIAFQATDVDAIARRIRQFGYPMRTRHIASISLFQILVADPDGLLIEISFPDVAEPPAWAA